MSSRPRSPATCSADPSATTRWRQSPPTDRRVTVSPVNGEVAPPVAVSAQGRDRRGGVARVGVEPRPMPQSSTRRRPGRRRQADQGFTAPLTPAEGYAATGRDRAREQVLGNERRSPSRRWTPPRSHEAGAICHERHHRRARDRARRGQPLLGVERRAHPATAIPPSPNGACRSRRSTARCATCSTVRSSRGSPGPPTQHRAPAPARLWACSPGVPSATTSRTPSRWRR